jgi:hypothetical protein
LEVESVHYEVYGTPKEYEPPRITEISLRPEEAVLSHCKIAGASGPIGASCNILIVQCSTVGS